MTDLYDIALTQPPLPINISKTVTRPERTPGKPLLIYIAGPLSATCLADVAQNVCDACIAGRAILNRGHYPYIPHLTQTFADSRPGHGIDYETYMAWDFAILERCDALYFIGPSPGANRERARAEELGIPVFLSPEEIPPC